MQENKRPYSFSYHQHAKNKRFITYEKILLLKNYGLIMKLVLNKMVIVVIQLVNQIIRNFVLLEQFQVVLD